MTTLIELDSRVTRLEELVRLDLSVRVDAMNWAIGQTYNNTEVTRLDVTGLRVNLAHLETSVRGDITKLSTALDLRTSELRHDLSDAEVSIRHDMGTFRNAVMQRFGAVDERLYGINQRFDGIDKRLDAMDQRFDAMDQRFDAMDQRFDGIDKRLDTMDQRFDGMDRRFDGMDRRFDELLAAIQHGNEKEI
jgi:flagellar capping protein FliD